jgi:hypothetical protein
MVLGILWQKSHFQRLLLSWDSKIPGKFSESNALADCCKGDTESLKKCAKFRQQAVVAREELTLAQPEICRPGGASQNPFTDRRTGAAKAADTGFPCGHRNTRAELALLALLQVRELGSALLAHRNTSRPGGG